MSPVGRHTSRGTDPHPGVSGAGVGGVKVKDWGPGGQSPALSRPVGSTWRSVLLVSTGSC